MSIVCMGTYYFGLIISMHRCLMGGDQLTAARGRGAQPIRENGGDPICHLEGFQMFSLDWHTKMNLLQVLP